MAHYALLAYANQIHKNNLVTEERKCAKRAMSPCQASRSVPVSVP